MDRFPMKPVAVAISSAHREFVVVLVTKLTAADNVAEH